MQIYLLDNRELVHEVKLTFILTLHLKICGQNGVKAKIKLIITQSLLSFKDNQNMDLSIIQHKEKLSDERTALEMLKNTQKKNKNA